MTQTSFAKGDTSIHTKRPEWGPGVRRMAGKLDPSVPDVPVSVRTSLRRHREARNLHQRTACHDQQDCLRGPESDDRDQDGGEHDPDHEPARPMRMQE